MEASMSSMMIGDRDSDILSLVRSDDSFERDLEDIDIGDEKLNQLEQDLMNPVRGSQPLSELRQNPLVSVVRES